MDTPVKKNKGKKGPVQFKNTKGRLQIDVLGFALARHKRCHFPRRSIIFSSGRFPFIERFQDLLSVR